MKKLFESTDFVQTVELWPPGFAIGGGSQVLDRQFAWLSERLEILGEYFDAFHIADLRVPGRRYLDSVTTSIRLRERFSWLEVAPTISARDRNRKSLQEAVATALYFGVDNLILVRGDPWLQTEEDHSKNVYEVNRVSELVQLAREVQQWTSAPELCLLTPLDVMKTSNQRYLETIRNRERATSDVFLTQMFVGEPEEYLERVDMIRGEGVKSPILHNVFPLYSYEDAQEISRRFGLPIAKGILDELKEGGAAAGIRVATRFRDAMEANKGKVNGIFVSSRGEPELAIRLVR